MSDIKTIINRFKFIRILSSNAAGKNDVVLGTVGDEHAILLIEKTAFKENANVIEQITDIFPANKNDIYYWATGNLTLAEDSPATKMTIIYPATELHIKKYSKQTYHMISETPEMYKNIVKPYIETMKGDRIKWVRNILFDNYEADKVIHNNDDFVLLPDMKWDGTTLGSLYLVCIVKRQDISSLRDLNSSHIDYLTKILIQIRKITKEHYNIRLDEFRLFVHYQPSYYHFHIHVVSINFLGLGNGVTAGKLILLEEIIEELKYLGEKGYENKTITYLIGENEDLWNLGIKTEHEKWLAANDL